MQNISAEFFDYKQADSLVWFTNIVCFYQWKWILVRWKWKTTWELPWWHIEKWETSLNSAKRELYEETWITWVELTFLCSRKSSWKFDNKEEIGSYYGNVYIVNVLELAKLPESEIEEIRLFTDIPENLTYPSTQIYILNKSREFIKKNKMFL